VSYTYGDDLISQHRPTRDSFYHYDAQFSTRALTDAAGDPTDTYTYDAFGVMLDQAGATANNYLYTGEQYDPNAGFYYLRARYYDPGRGRFLTTDPFEGKPFEPETLHKYMYAKMNPVMYVDPSGNISASLTEVTTIMAISYALNSIVMPNLARLKSYAGRTNRFVLEFGFGGNFGEILHFGGIKAYISEIPPTDGDGLLKPPRKRGVFDVALIGFGAGIGVSLPADRIFFSTNTRRNLEHFEGVGRITYFGASYKNVGPSCTEIQMAEGTQLPLLCSPLEPSVSAGNFGAFVDTAFWDFKFKDEI